MRLRFHEQAGSSLVELVVGSAIALLALGAVVGLQIRAYRYHRADESRYVAQQEAANGMERMVQDLRSASQVALAGAECRRILTVHVDGGAIHYARTEDGRVTRTAGLSQPQTIGSRVECLEVREVGGAFTVEWTVAPADGSPFTLRSTAAPRVGGSPAH